MCIFNGMTNRLWLLLAAATLSLGCVGDPECGARDGGAKDGNMCASRLTGELRMSNKFSQEQQESILRATDDWAEWTGFRVSVSFQIVDSDPDIFPAVLPAGVLGQQWSEAGTIQISGQLSPEKTRVVAQHELGHYFGLGHVTDPAQNLHPDGEVTIMLADIEHFDRLWQAASFGGVK